MKKILIVVGTRPNFIKITRFPQVFNRYKNVECKIVHTGQHYDDAMSRVFFSQFGIKPDIFLGIEQGTQIMQIAGTIKGLELVMNEYFPHLVIVVGDVNSTFAGAFAANRLGIRVAHVESGLRSFDPSMPEEWNRKLTDLLADYLFVTEKSGLQNLRNERRNTTGIYFVGNTMIDTLVAFHKQIDRSDILRRLNLERKQYILMTMHRPSNVDSQMGLEKIIRIISKLGKENKIVFPVHPRTVSNLKKFRIYDRLLDIPNLILLDPLDYFSFQKLTKECLLVLTDSGGIQEETTFLKVPCFTLRSSTERPVTITLGTNTMIPFDYKVIDRWVRTVKSGKYRKGRVPPLWDGKTTERIVKIIMNKIF